MRPAWIIAQAKKYVRRTVPRGLFVSCLPRECGNSVLLSFDDGPHPDGTPAVLEVLKQFKARAVFFVVGNRVKRAPQLLKRILDEGHLLGNHSFAHTMDRAPGYAEYRQDLGRCQQEIYQQAGYTPGLHRPPLGATTFATLVAPRAIGLQTVLWSVSSEDWRFRSDAEAEQRVESLKREIAPRDIILFHDERVHTAVALRKLLPQLVDSGFDLCPPSNWFTKHSQFAGETRR